MAKFRRLGEGCEIQRSRVAGAGHAPAGAAFGAPPFCPPLGLPNRFWNISRGLSWMAWVRAGICDASALTWICVVSNGRITASTISVIEKCRNKQWIGIGRAPAARAIKGRTVRPPSRRRPCPRGWRHAASPRAHERRPESRLGRADSREKGAFRPASTDERGDGSTATSSSDDPASFLREFADVALKMQTAALEGVADVPAQLAKQLQRAAAPPPQGFPPGPAGDAAVELGADPLAFIVKTQRDHGDVVGLSLAGERVVLVSDPTVAADVMIDRAELFVKEGTAFFPGSSLAGEGLLVSDGDSWARQRRLSNPAFRKAAVETYANAMASAGLELLQNEWAARSVRDVYEDFNDLTLRIVAEALFGADMRGTRAREINDAIKEAFEFFGKRSATGMIVPEWVPIPDNFAYNAAVTRLDKAVYSLIRERRERRVDGVDVLQTDRLDLLDRLLDAVDDGEGGDGGGMDDVSLRDELMTLMVAGQETSAILLSWCCVNVASNPSCAVKLAEEANTVVGSNPLRDLPNASHYPRLKYAEAAVLETMRLQPPAYMVGRCCAEDVFLSGGKYSLPKGTTVLIAPYLLHNDARYWDAPGEFRPERWLTPGGVPKKRAEVGGDEESLGDESELEPMAKGALKGMGPGGVYVPFGAGPRVCIGTGFAMMESTLLLAMVARAVDVRLRPGAPPPKPRALITLRPENARLDVVPKRRWW
jgi:cytochrome P450